MTHSEIAAVFKRAFNGRMNPMTPQLVAYGKKGNLLYEISTGRGIRGGPIYGVTVLTLTGERVPKLSQVFGSRSEAHAFTKTL